MNENSASSHLLQGRTIKQDEDDSCEDDEDVLLSTRKNNEQDEEDSCEDDEEVLWSVTS